jgi:hypothetical protein
MPSTFLSLPRELRDTIYGYALISCDPILVFSGPYPHLGRPAAPKSSISNVLALGLVRSNRIISQESIEIFYSMNTFAFLGDHDWDSIVSWLNSIRQNRDHLRRLNITALQPEQCWQNANGTRARIPGMRGELYPRNPYLSPSAQLTGPVENIKPGIETIFILLGTRRTGNLTISLLMDYDVFPGLYRERDHAEGGDDFTMDLPNLIERFRSNHTENGDSRVEVLWIGEAQRSHFLDNENMIQQRGWEIVTRTEAERVYYRTWKPPPGVEMEKKVTTLTMKYTLQRKEITHVLVAEDPSPYGMASLEAYSD